MPVRRQFGISVDYRKMERVRKDDILSPVLARRLARVLRKEPRFGTGLIQERALKSAMERSPEAPQLGGFPMKNRVWMALLLAAALAVPVLAQQNSTTSDQSQPTASQPATTQQTPADQGSQPAMQTDKNAQTGTTPSTTQGTTTGAHQPLVVDKKQGFWG